MPLGSESLFMLNPKPSPIYFGDSQINEDGYTIRNYQRGNTDYAAWCNIEVSVGEFGDYDSALKRFRQWTNMDEKQLSRRCLFLCCDSQPVGTVSAWQGEFQGELRGRIHWLAIRPEHQGKGLSRHLMNLAVAKLAVEHNSIYLKTEPDKLAAINLYLSMGFEPVVRNVQDTNLWKLVADRLNRPTLGNVQKFLSNRSAL